MFLPRESHGQRSLVGGCPWGCTKSDMTEAPQGSVLMAATSEALPWGRASCLRHVLLSKAMNLKGGAGRGSNMLIREMEDTYGLLPMPKYDKEQENYGTTTQDYYTLMSVIDHAESSVPTKGKAISAFLQLMTEESYTSVRGYYFNRIIKPKYFGTDDSEGTVTNSIALFDIIVANIEFEYWTIYSAALNNLSWLWRRAIHFQDASIELGYLTDEAAYAEAIVETDIWLGLRSE